MIQDIHPHLFSNTYIANSETQENDFIFHFKGNALLLKKDNDKYEIPQRKQLQKCNSEGLFLFTLNKVNCFLVWECSKPDDATYAFYEINFLRNLSQPEIDWAGSLAFQLMNWYVKNKFCGKCGSLNEIFNSERTIVCPSCNQTLYPSIYPAIIVAIRCNDKLLLARGAHFQEGFYSLVAGYADVGESLEDTVIREVKEEVGLDIKNIRYYKSQPWPFSGSMMIGFIAEADENQPIQVDNKEILHAAWFNKNNLPNYPPTRSIAGEIIEKYLKDEL